MFLFFTFKYEARSPAKMGMGMYNLEVIGEGMV